MSKLFYFGNDDVDRQISQMNLVEENHLKIYYNIKDESYWEKIETNSIHLRNNTSILIKQPEPDTSVLIHFLFTSEDNNEVAAAASILKENEIRKEKEFRVELLSELEKLDIKKLDELQRKRVHNIILLTELNFGENRRSILNKKYEIIQADSEFYLDIAIKADQILENLKPNFFERLFKINKKLPPTVCF